MTEGTPGQEPAPTPPAAQPEPPAEGQEPAQEPVEGAKGPEPKTFDEKYVRELRKQAADSRTRAVEAEEKLKEIADREKSESERLTEQATTAKAEAEEAKAKLLRFEIAAERELDLRAAGFLTGTTREEIEARADELVALLAERAEPKKPTLDGGARKTPEKRGSPEQEHNELLLEALGRGKQT
jgi:hypothetical protein